MLTYAQWRMEVVGMLLYTQVLIAFRTIQTLLRLFLAFKALSRPHPALHTGFSLVFKALRRLYSIKALLRLYAGSCFSIFNTQELLSVGALIAPVC